MRGFIFTVAVLAAAMLSEALAQGELRLFLPVQEVDNLGKSRLQSDAAGGIHIVAPSIVGNGFTYMYCPPGCSGEEQLSEVRFDTDSNGAEVALALDPSGKPHIVIGDYLSLSYARCTGDCGSAAGWERGLLTSWDQPDWQISGDSLAIGPDGQSHFLLHGRSELFSDGPHNTWYYSCAADCQLGGNWRATVIEDEQNYTHTSLHVRGDGTLVGGFVAAVNYDLGMEYPIIAYFECAADCHAGDSWGAVGLYTAYDAFWTEDVPPAVSLALDSAGQPHLTFLGRSGSGEPELIYMACAAADCLDGDNWPGLIIVDSSDASIGAGVHLSIGADDRALLSSTVGQGVVTWTCSSDCVSGNWELGIIENAEDLDADAIFLYTNCVIGAWFLKDPQSAQLPDGRIVSAYTAEDYSFGGAASDPNRPSCPIGMDMSLGRLVLRSP